MVYSEGVVFLGTLHLRELLLGGGGTTLVRRG